MTIKEFIEQKKKDISNGAIREVDPKSLKLVFLDDVEAERYSNVKTYKYWYNGNGDDLLAWYTNQKISGFGKNLIRNRNKRNYFWSQSSGETDIKRIHSGIPQSIIDALSNVLGKPQITDATGKWDDICEENDFYTKLSQQARPLTMAMGYGAWKVNIDKKVSNHPIWEFYDAENVDFTFESGILTGIIFTSFYKKDNKDYCLFETRFKQDGNSYIVYDLFEDNNDNITPVDLSILEQTKDLKDLKIIGFNEILAVESKYFYNPTDSRYGKSLYDGKIDLFDELDEALSIQGETVRSSTPITWVAPDVMDRGPNGLPTMPNRWNLKFMQKPSVPDGDGNVSDDIVVTQPQLNIEQYSQNVRDLMDMIFVGRISPASLGIDIAKKDNATAQREKEKVTLMTRLNVMNAEKRAIRKIVKLSIVLDQYMQTGEILLQPLDVKVDFSEFANPSFEEELQILGNAYSSGEISTETYVNKLYPDWTEEQKQKEIEWLESNKQQENQEQNFDNLLGEDYVSKATGNVEEAGPEEEPTTNTENQFN